AQHNDMRFPRRAVVVGVEKPANRRLETQHREVVARYEEAFAALRLTARREVGGEGDVRGDPREGRLYTLQIAEHRVAEDRVAVACLAARRAARLRSVSCGWASTGRAPASPASPIRMRSTKRSASAGSMV